MAEHVLKRFDEELNKLKYRLVKMSALVQQQIELAFSSLLDNNSEYAKVVISMEKKVDKMDLKIDKQCLRIFALHQPVAMDLRLVLSSFSINDNLELIGDFAKNIAVNIIEMSDSKQLIENTRISEMGQSVEVLFAKTIDSYINTNNELALQVIKDEISIKAIFKENFSLITELMKKDNTLIVPYSYLLDINRNIHLIAIQIKSIAQELIFLFEARMIKHSYFDDEDNSEKSEEN